MRLMEISLSESRFVSFSIFCLLRWLLRCIIKHPAIRKFNFIGPNCETIIEFCNVKEMLMENRTFLNKITVNL